MNENIDLTKILKDCPKGTKFYSLVHGEVTFVGINEMSKDYPIEIILTGGLIYYYTANGKLDKFYKGECILFPSKDQRDWSKFTAPWYKKEKFDPKTLKPFDKVLVRNYTANYWCCGFFSYISMFKGTLYKYVTENSAYWKCIPYNDDTKHLVGTTDEAPEYYRYWGD